jgi:hypothetical protein
MAAVVLTCAGAALVAALVLTRADRAAPVAR